MMNRIVLALNDINEKYICENEPRKCFYKDDGIKKICKIVVFIAAAFILTLSILLNVFMPVGARRFPLLGNVFSYIQDNLDFAGLYDKYAQWCAVCLCHFSACFISARKCALPNFSGWCRLLR